MSNKRDNKFKKTGISLLRLLVVITMVQYMFAGTLPSQAAPVADVDLVTGFDLLQSVAPPAWSTVSGSLGSGFTMTLDPTVSFYYLNVANLAASPALKEAYHPFVVTATPPGFFTYWAGRGVCDGCGGTWEPVMWEIINGRQPIFYLKVGSGLSYMLVDGLTKDAFGGGDQYLRVDGTYLPGDYTFTGTITDTTESTSQLPVNITFELIQYQLSVNKTGNGSGTVTSNPAGIDCGVTCTQDFDHGTVVTLTATAATGSTFNGWSGEGCTGTGTCIVTISAARSVTPTFTLDQYTLSVNKTGTGSGTVSSIPAGIDCGGDCTNVYDYGTVITLTAAADTGSAFKGWSGATCSGTGDCIVTISAAETVTATFNSQRQLTVNKNGAGSGTVTSNPAGIDCGATCANDFDVNTVVTLTATASTGSTFSGWNGATCTGSGDCLVTMSAAETVTATFTLNQYTLDVSKTGSGTVSSNPAGIDCGSDCSEDYDYGTVVTLTATPDSGWGFFGWEVDLTGSTNPITLTIDGDKSVTAVFKQYFVFLPLVRQSVVFSDIFNYSSELISNNWDILVDPDSTTPATWTTLNGELHGKHTVADRNSKAMTKVYPPQMPGSYSVEAKAKLASGSVAGARAGLLFDCFDNTQTYRFVIVPGVASPNDNWWVQKLVNGSWNFISSSAHGRATNMLPRDQYNLLRVERLADGSIKVYLNNTLLWSGSDATYQNGQAGLNIGTPILLGFNGFVEVIFDDFLIGDLQ